MQASLCVFGLTAGSDGWLHLPPSHARPHHVQDNAAEVKESCARGRIQRDHLCVVQIHISI